MMDSTILYSIAHDALVLALLLSLPLLGVAFFTGTIVGFLASYTKLSEPAIGITARILAGMGTLVLISPWLADRAMSFATKTWLLLSTVVT